MGAPGLQIVNGGSAADSEREVLPIRLLTALLTVPTQALKGAKDLQFSGIHFHRYAHAASKTLHHGDIGDGQCFARVQVRLGHGAISSVPRRYFAVVILKPGFFLARSSPL